MAHWLRLCTSTAGDVGSIPDRGTRIPHALWSRKKKKKKNPYSKALRACAMLCLVAQLSLTVLRSHGLYPVRLL